MDLSEKTLLFVGCGNMGGALALGVRALELQSVLLFDVDAGKPKALADQEAGTPVASLAEGIAKADIVLLAVKPQNLPDFLLQNKSCFRPQQILISILAGIPVKRLTESLPCRVVRAMPNTPAQVDEGLTALCGSDDDALAVAGEIFDCVGEVVRVIEPLMDGVTALSGSGPAYVFYFAEALLKAAAEQGFDPETAKALVYQTLKGAVTLLTESEETAEELRKKVTSKGGTTEAALAEMQRSSFVDTVCRAVAAASARSKALAS